MSGGVDLARRGLLSGRMRPAPRPTPPPWSRDASLAAACTGCGACAASCPQGILRLDSRLPRVDFTAECTFCGACAAACPEPVFDRALRPAFDHIVAVGASCFAARGVVCQSCGDACPETAIRFRPRLGGPALPEIDPSACSGCGACMAVCPADAVALLQSASEAGRG